VVLTSVQAVGRRKMQWKVEDLAVQTPADEITNSNVRSLFMQSGRLVYFALHVKREEEFIRC
jgi:hypothetical protein